MKLKRVLPASLLLGGFTILVLAQDDAVFKAGVNVVSLLATVRDKHGRLVDELTQDDFVLKEDGKAQTVRYFTRQTELPMTVGLLVDTSLSQRRLIDDERSASAVFIKQMIDETKDQAFLIRFDFEVQLLQDLTSSRALLQKALDDLHLPGERDFRTRQLAPTTFALPEVVSHQFPGGGIPGQYPGGSPYPRSRRGGNYPGGPTTPGPVPSSGRPTGTAMYDSVYLAAREVLRDQAGRKAIVVISDGVDMGSKVTSDEAIEAAQRADVVIYSVYYSDDEGYRMQAGGGPTIGNAGWRPNGEFALESLCKQTGGSLYKVSSKMTLSQVFDEIQQELRNQYSIGYSSTNDSGSSDFRRIKLEVKGDKYKVFTRAGYYPRQN